MRVLGILHDIRTGSPLSRIIFEMAHVCDAGRGSKEQDQCFCLSEMQEKKMPRRYIIEFWIDVMVD